MNIIKPPNQLPHVKMLNKSLFLAGSIDMGVAVDWQKTVQNELQDLEGTIFNPRRDTWDPTWEQSLKNPKFVEQVNWEMDALNMAETIMVYFDPNTKSPITFFELGYNIKSGRVILCCPDGFWRKGNIEVYAQRQRMKVHNTLNEMIDFYRGLYKIL